jgi:putative alpha-1,2-mannosidase
LVHGDYITPRERNGAFVPDFSPTSPHGFAEGNAAQYTWMVPQDPRGLFARLGGRRRATTRLRHFFRSLDAINSASESPSAVLSNEPNMHTPFLFNWAGRPDLSAVIERRALKHLFGAGAAGLPGNDDLGAMSSWYVFGSLGLFPEVPGVGMLVISSPLFPSVTLHLAGGDVHISAPGADTLPFVSSMELNGQPYGASWIPFCSIAGGAQLSYSMSTKPGPQWGRGGGRPPSFSPQRRAPNGFCGI